MQPIVSIILLFHGFEFTKSLEPSGTGLLRAGDSIIPYKDLKITPQSQTLTNEFAKAQIHTIYGDLDSKVVSDKGITGEEYHRGENIKLDNNSRERENLVYFCCADAKNTTSKDFYEAEISSNDTYIRKVECPPGHKLFVDERKLCIRVTAVASRCPNGYILKTGHASRDEESPIIHSAATQLREEITSSQGARRINPKESRIIYDAANMSSQSLESSDFDIDSTEDATAATDGLVCVNKSFKSPVIVTRTEKAVELSTRIVCQEGTIFESSLKMCVRHRFPILADCPKGFEPLFENPRICHGNRMVPLIVFCPEGYKLDSVTRNSPGVTPFCIKVSSSTCPLGYSISSIFPKACQKLSQPVLHCPEQFELVFRYTSTKFVMREAFCIPKYTVMRNSSISFQKDPTCNAVPNGEEEQQREVCITRSNENDYVVGSDHMPVPEQAAIQVTCGLNAIFFYEVGSCVEFVVPMVPIAQEVFQVKSARHRCPKNAVLVEGEICLVPTLVERELQCPSESVPLEHHNYTDSKASEVPFRCVEPLLTADMTLIRVFCPITGELVEWRDASGLKCIQQYVVDVILPPTSWPSSSLFSFCPISVHKLEKDVRVRVSEDLKVHQTLEVK